MLVPIAIDLSATLTESILPKQGPSRLVSELLPALQETFFQETGIVLPTARVYGDDARLVTGDYAIRLQEIPVAHGNAFINTDPARASLLTPEDVIADHLLHVLRQHGYVFVGIQETQALLEGLQRTHPHLVREVVPQLVSPVLLADILQRLAREGISLRHLVEILEALAKRASGETDAAALAEDVRRALCRQITFKYSNPDGSVGVFFLDAMIEETVREAIRKTATGAHLALEPELSHDIVRAVGSAVADVASPVLLTTGDIRRHLRSLLESEQPQVAVLAHQELMPEAKLHTLGRISV
jgi:type III secretion protein V